MTQMPDDDPELAMSPAVIPPDVDFLPALIGGEGPVSAARICVPINCQRSRLHGSVHNNRNCPPLPRAAIQEPSSSP